MSVRGVSGPVRPVRVAAQHAGRAGVSWWDEVVLLIAWGFLDVIALLMARPLLVLMVVLTVVQLVRLLRCVDVHAAAERERARLAARHPVGPAGVVQR